MEEKVLNLIKGTNEVADQFINGDKNAISNLIKVIDGIQEMVNYLALKKVSKELIVELNSYLNQIIEAIENGDITLIGDLMKYELVPIIEKLIEYAK